MAQRKIPNNGQTLVEKYSPSQDQSSNQDFTIFVDAAFCEVTNSYSTGFAISDPGGKIMAASFRKIKPPGTVLAAEL